MVRSAFLLASLTLLALLALAPERAAAAPPLAGTTICGLQGQLEFRPYLPLVPTPSGKSVRLKGQLSSLSCDGGAVTGGAGPLRSALVQVLGRMPAGTDCSNLLGAIGIEKGVLRVRWLGADGTTGRTVTLGISKAKIAMAAFDDVANTFVLTTAPIAKGAFTGSTLSFTIPFGDDAAVEEYTRVCNRPEGGGFSKYIWDTPQNGLPTLSVP